MQPNWLAVYNAQQIVFALAYARSRRVSFDRAMEIIRIPYRASYGWMLGCYDTPHFEVKN